jgi:dihydrofolate reductase
MRKLILWDLVTLDGYFEGKKSWDLGFHELIWNKELEDFSLLQLKSADIIIFGKVTYDGMASHWQTATGEIAKYMNSIQKIVCSRTLTTAYWNNTTIVKDAVPEIKRLKQEGNGNMFVFGSGKLSQTFINANLFDEYRLVIVPVLLGNGERLFKPGLHYQKLKLLETLPIASDGVLLRYSPVIHEEKE